MSDLIVYYRSADFVVSEAPGLPADDGQRWIRIDMLATTCRDRYVEIHESEAARVGEALIAFARRKSAS